MIRSRICNSSFVLLVGLLLVSGSALATKLDCSGTKNKIKQTLSIKPGDRPDRELTQTVRVDVVSSDNPELNGIEETVYMQSDTVGGAGDHYGYSVFPLNSGEKLWVKFHGTHYFVARSDKDWEVPFQGVYVYIAGTGKYKAIRGGGHYEGKMTPAGIAETFTCSAEY